MDKLGITVFDVAVIALAVFGAMIGASAGFAHAVMFIASWIAAGWVAWKYAKAIQPEVEQLVNSPELAYFLSMLALFVAALIVLVMLTNTLSRSVRASPLGKPDRILGAGFGVLCTWVAVGTAFLFYTFLGPKALPPAVEGAATFPLIREMATFVDPQLPTGFRTRLSGRTGDAGAVSPASPAAPTAPATDAPVDPPAQGTPPAKPPQ